MSSSDHPSVIHLRRRFRPFSSAVTFCHPSPATFPALFVPCHLRLSLSGNVSGRFRRPSPPAATSSFPLRQHFRPFSSPVTSGQPSPATFPATFIARHLRQLSPATFPALIVPITFCHTSPATFPATSVARHLRPSLPGNVSGRFRRPSPPAIPPRQRFRPFSFPATSLFEQGGQNRTLEQYNLISWQARLFLRSSGIISDGIAFPHIRSRHPVCYVSLHRFRPETLPSPSKRFAVADNRFVVK